MENIERITNNRLIASYMGVKTVENKQDKKDFESFTLDELHYHESWDWLIPVFRRISQDPKVGPWDKVNLCAAWGDGIYDEEILFVWRTVVEIINF